MILTKTNTDKGITVVLPIVTMNGSGAENLLYQRQDAASGIRDAIGHLNEMTPHPRDYQGTTSSEAYDAAMRQHNDRVRKLERILDEIEMEMEHIAPFVKPHVTPRSSLSTNDLES